MYPPQTSLIPATIAIARFIESNGVEGFNNLYPYWYTGVPTKYLFGPLIPALLSTLKWVLPFFDYFQLSILLIGFSFIVSAMLWGWFSALLTKDKRVGYLVTLVYFIMPYKFLSALALDETSLIIARNLTPLVLIFAYKMLSKHKTPYYWLILIVSISFLMLINFTIGLQMVILLIVLALCMSFRKRQNKYINFSKLMKRVIIAVIWGMGLVTFWYGLYFWLILLTNPSVGGDPFYKGVVKIFDFVKMLVPIALAFTISRVGGLLTSRFRIFSLTYFGAFALLSLFRFMANPWFWTDWISHLVELEQAGLLLFVSLITPNTAINLEEIQVKKYISAGSILSISMILTVLVYKQIGSPKLVTGEPPEIVFSLEKLNQLAKGQRVFISGSTVFWANAFYNLPQLRGGIDQMVTNKNIIADQYELREGEAPVITQSLLNKYQIKYVLVHAPASTEYYKDFINQDKWERVGKLVWENNGDKIYEIK